ncbi:hypothetical protein COCSADRAFT_260939 [Bipolaris sorokiniana ND90Pr]|uniref:Uncharacterized protein n=1 Tax=Cochliobolus sativus (strain ND90Pr / ATCC 201652) TaxID=665912 RepID=M2SQ13_COCSN|nr:uncharacterized protein COCSADRAFT_260939 [Bipolaris sorokiniana ND90Pr]EMD58857.1 hypothetical protein COCSADRAFT_260939 [Bipolaris sorokiniana ND90Pr]
MCVRACVRRLIQSLVWVFFSLLFGATPTYSLLRVAGAWCWEVMGLSSGYKSRETWA